MRFYIPVLALMLFSSTATAQEQTLISGYISHGGFGGPIFQLTQFDGQAGIMIGGRGGWIIDHAFFLGGGGMALINDIEVYPAPDNMRYLDFGYGGLDLGFILASDRLIHMTVSSLIGGGAVQYRSSSDYDHDNHTDDDPFLMIQPEVNLEINVTRFFRVAMGGGYRYITGIDLDGISDDMLSGPMASVTLKFGSF